MQTSLQIFDDGPNVSPEPPPQRQHFWGWDWVRAGAAIGVVALHAGVPYLTHPMPGLAWPVTDQASPIVDGLFWSIEVFIMPLFLVMAGCFAVRTLAKATPQQLVSGRAKRLLRPLLFGVLCLLPIELYLWVLGWVSEGIVPAIKLRSLKFDQHIDQHLWGLSHLWFLLYLFSYVCVLAVVSKLWQRWSPNRNRTFLRPGTEQSVVLAVVMLLGTASLALYPEVVWGFQHDFLPVPSKWIYSGLFFLLGAVLGKADPQTLRIERFSPRLVGLAGCLLVMAVMIGTWSLEISQQSQTVSSGTIRFAEDPIRFLSLGAITTAAAITVSLAILSVSLRWVTRPSRWAERLAAASFWIYLVHHPIVGLVHIDLKWLAPTLSPTIKMLLTLMAVTLLSFASYEVLVRRTRFGIWLGMAQTPQTGEPAPTNNDDESESVISIAPHEHHQPADWPHRRAA